MSRGVTSHRGLHYRALPGEGVFLVKNVIGFIKTAEGYLSVTSCLSTKKKEKKKESAAEADFNIQVSTAGLSLSSAQRNILINHSQVLSVVCVRCILCVADFIVVNISPMGRTFDV